MACPAPPTPSAGLPSIGSASHASKEPFACLEEQCTSNTKTFPYICQLLIHMGRSHKIKYCKTCCLFFARADEHDSERCADRYCMSPCCPSAAVGETLSCTVMCQRHVRAWKPKKCHTWREVGQVEDGVALWSYLKRLYQGLLSPDATVTPCPFHSPQPHILPPNDEQVSPNATCNKCVALEGLEIENCGLKIALENANQSAAQLQSTVEYLLMKLARLQPPVPDVPQCSMQDNAPPPTLDHGNLAIPPGSGTGHDDIPMNQNGPALDSGYASIPPVAACVSGDTNLYSYDHPVTGHVPTNAYLNQFEEFPMMFGVQDNAANDSINAPHMSNVPANDEIFSIDMEVDSAASANTREMQLQQSSLSIPHYNQNPWTLAQEYNSSAQQRGHFGGSDIPMTAPWDIQPLPRQ